MYHTQTKRAVQQLAIVPLTWGGTPICLRQLAGICNCGDLKCPWVHLEPEERETVELPIEISRAILAQGTFPGHEEACLLSLRSCVPHGYLPAHLPRDQIEMLGWWHLDRVLESCLELHHAKHPHDLVAKSKCRYCETVIVETDKSPIRLFGATGTPISGVKAVTIGTGNSFIEVVEYNTSGQVELLNGVMLQERCLPVAIAANLRNEKNFIRQPGASWSVEIIREINECLLEFTRESLIKNLGSRMTEIWLMCSINPQELGYSESLCDIVLPELLRNTNFCLIANGGLEDVESRDKDCIRVWTAGGTMMKERTSIVAKTPKQREWASRFTKSWNFGAAATSSPLIAAVSKFVEDGGKHSNPATLGKRLNTLTRLMDMLGDLIEFGDPSVEIAVKSYARLTEMKARPALGLMLGGITEAMIDDAFVMLEKEKQLLHQNMVPFEVNPFWRAGVQRKANRLEKERAAPRVRASLVQETIPSASDGLAGERIDHQGARPFTLPKPRPAASPATMVQRAEEGVVAEVVTNELKVGDGSRGYTKGVHAKKTLKEVCETADRRRELARVSDLLSVRIAAQHMDLVDTFRDNYDKADADAMFAQLRSVNEIDVKWKEACILEMRSTAAISAPSASTYSTGIPATSYQQTNKESPNLWGDWDPLDNPAISHGYSSRAKYEEARQAEHLAKTLAVGDSLEKRFVDAAAHGVMMGQMRKIAFGEDRMQNGPQVADIPSEFWLSLPEGNEAMLKTQMREGIKATRLGPKVGYIGQDREEVIAHEAHLMSSVMKHLVTYKVIVPVAGEADKSKFVAEGGIIAPWGVVDKKDDRGRVRDEKRALMDHFDDKGGREANKFAKNSGTYSFRYSRQLATNKASLAAIAIVEEDANPGYFVKAVKFDYSDAFPTNGEREEDVDDICASVRDLVIVYGYYTFGGSEAPGVWENTGSAAAIAANSMEWNYPEENGTTVPRNGRVVDDTVIICVDKGTRQEDFAKGFKNMMSWVAGSTANNAKKEEESGGFTFHQHTFGDLFDSAKRGMQTPLSRLCREEDKVLPFLKNRKMKLTAEEIPSLRGTLNSNFSNAPQLGFFLPRLDAMMSDMCTKFGSHPPSNYEPSPSLSVHESEDVALALFRCEL